MAAKSAKSADSPVVLKEIKFSLAHRAAGVLLHPTSLPGPHGGGDLGDEAYAFVEFLKSAGVRWWQMLPTTPIGPGNSPYSSPSAFAGEPALINLDYLVDEGLLQAEDVRPPAGFERDRVRFAPMLKFRASRLRLAWRAFSQRGTAELREDLAEFCNDEQSWLDDYALFQALKRAHRGKPWTAWDKPLRDCKKLAIAAAREKLRNEIDYQRFVQFLYDRQWSALRHFCHMNGVGVLGDIPIFVTHDSADVWAHRELFLLDGDGHAKVVSGCPPDPTFTKGQRWGHPHFAWPLHRRSGYAWWVSRFAETLKRFDAARIDHFLGFNQVFQIPASAKFTEGGKYVPTPGDELFLAVRSALGKMEIIAEDLGNVTDGARELRDKHKFPGMRILQNAFWDGSRYDQPHNYPPNSVAYTGTHDNETVVGWYRAFSRRPERGRDGLTNAERIQRYLGRFSEREIQWDFIRLVMASSAALAVVPMQDLLGLDNAARMNTPATPRGNWEWRMRPGAASAAIAQRLHQICEAYERA